MTAALRGGFEVAGRPVGFLREGDLDGRPLVFLAHGAGAPWTSEFLQSAAEGLLARGLAVVRFHFPYMEEAVRSGRRLPPDRAPLLLDTWREMLQQAAQWSTKEPWVMAGKSLGARMASMLLAQQSQPRVRAAVYLGYPLHPAGDPRKLRSAHLAAVRVPQLFVSGSRDALCDLELLRPLVTGLSGATLEVVDGGDHSLAVRRAPAAEVRSAWLDRVAAFVTEHCGR